MGSAELNLQLATNWMSTISLFLLIIFGLFGAFCNLIIFLSKELRKNSCSIYFLCTALFEIFILSFGGISRLATEHFRSTFLEQNLLFCKIRAYLNTSCSQAATCLLLMAAIDRFMSTSIHVQYRVFSQLKIAYRVVPAVIIFIVLMNIHVLIYFDIRSTCIPRPGTYAVFYSIQLIVSTAVLPDTLMIVFTLGILKNIKQLRLRNTTIAIPNGARDRAKQRMENQLVIMMFAQATITIFLDLTRTSLYAYYFITANTLSTTYEKRVATFIFQLSNILLYLNYSKSFYIYTLASSFFRKIFLDLLQSHFRRFSLFLHPNHIHPANQTINET